ncbi:putative phospholipase A2, partial [Lachnellula suecica]
MTSYLSRLSPVPAFPAYTGPYTVGTLDIELPVSELEAPSASPDDSISTVNYRVFYPCDPGFKGKNVSFIPSPQRDYVAAYTRFLGAGNMLAEAISFFPRLLHYIQIPALKNAPLLEPPTSEKRWPVMLFSHGLGGSRNAYSHIVGSIASHGMIVIAPEHRDGSTPVSYIRAPPSVTGDNEKRSDKVKKRVDYHRISHTPSPEVEEGRNAQLRIRLWEMGLIHDSLLKLDINPSSLTNLNTSTTPLTMFGGKMDVHRPGKMVFAGHSFGASTTAQLVKSTFYAPRNSEAP